MIIIDLICVVFGAAFGVYFATLFGLGTLRVYFYPRPAVYMGNLRQDKMHGLGSMYYLDGSYYLGEWNNGLFHGVGSLKYSDGGVYEGHFEHGQKHGAGFLKYPNGTSFAVHWIEDKKEGMGVFTEPCGWRWIGRFENDCFTEEGTVHPPVVKGEKAWSEPARSPSSSSEIPSDAFSNVSDAFVESSNE